MIRLNSSFKREDNIDSVKVDNSNINEIVKQSLIAFNQRFLAKRYSTQDKITELELNYLVELIRSKFQEIDDSANHQQIDDLTSEQKNQIDKIIQDNLEKRSQDVRDQISKTIIDNINEKSEESRKKDADKNEDLEYDSDFLELVFDQYYKKGNKYQDVKNEIEDELIDRSNDVSRIYKEQLDIVTNKANGLLHDYRKRILELRKKIIEINVKNETNRDKIVKKINSQNEQQIKEEQKKIRKNVIKNLQKIPMMEKPKNVMIEGATISKNLLKMIKKNQQKNGRDEKKRELSEQDIQRADNLVDKFYRNGKIELKLKMIKNLFGFLGKIMFFLSPIFSIARKFLGFVKNIGKKIFRLGTNILTSKFSLSFLLTPQGQYMTGFFLGIVTESIKQWWKGDSITAGIFRTIFNIITPLIKISIGIVKTLSPFFGFILRHPLLFVGIYKTLDIVFNTLDKLPVLKAGFKMVKKGLPNLGNFLLAYGVMSATETIFNEAVFSSKTEKGLNFAKKNVESYYTMTSGLNSQSIGNMNKISLGKYQNLQNAMDKEVFEINKILTQTEIIQKSIENRDEYNNYDLNQLMGKSFIDHVFYSNLYGNNTEGRYNFNKIKGLKDQLNAVAEELNNRLGMLNRTQAVLTYSSTISSEKMMQRLDEIVEETSDGTKLRADFIKKANGGFERSSGKGLRFNAASSVVSERTRDSTIRGLYTDMTGDIPVVHKFITSFVKGTGQIDYDSSDASNMGDLKFLSEEDRSSLESLRPSDDDRSQEKMGRLRIAADAAHSALQQTTNGNIGMEKNILSSVDLRQLAYIIRMGKSDQKKLQDDLTAYFKSIKEKLDTKWKTELDNKYKEKEELEEEIRKLQSRLENERHELKLLQERNR